VGTSLNLAFVCVCLKAHIATSETNAAQHIAAKDREIADLQAKARVLPDKQLLKKKDEEIAAMETALNSLHSFKSSLLMQLRMRDENIRALKADLAAARAVSEAAAARADSEVTAARVTAEAAVARAATEVAAAQAASQAAAGQASTELAARTASRCQEVGRVQRLSAAYYSDADALYTCLCDTRDNLELYNSACELYEDGNRLLRQELLAIHVDISQSVSDSTKLFAAAHSTFSEASASCRQLVWLERRESTCDSELVPVDGGLIVPKETSAAEEHARIAAAREALIASQAQLRATEEAIAAEIGAFLTYPGVAVITTSDNQGGTSGSTQ
jgi:subtilase-type serine protease